MAEHRVPTDQLKFEEFFWLCESLSFHSASLSNCVDSVEEAATKGTPTPVSAELRGFWNGANNWSIQSLSQVSALESFNLT